MSRALLQSDNALIFRQEVETAMGSVLTGRLATDSSSSATTPIITYSPKPDGIVSIRALVVARQDGGSVGTVGNSARFELLGTFKIIAGVVSQIGTTTSVCADRDSTDWSATLTADGTNIIVNAVLAGAYLNTNADILWNAYFYIHALGGS